MPLRLLGVLRLGILLCLLLRLPVSWESAFLSMCVTAFLRLEQSLLWQLLFARNLLLIPSVCRGNQNNCLPRTIEGILQGGLEMLEIDFCRLPAQLIEFG